MDDTLFPIEESGKPQRARRVPDELFDALCYVCKIKHLDLTVSGRGMLNRALKELRDAGATPPEILRRGQAYQERFSGTPTPGALARHWAGLSTRPQAVKKAPAPEQESEQRFIDRQELARRAREYREMHR